MGRKETTTKEDLMATASLLEQAGIRYWIDGGWYVFEKDVFSSAVLEGKTFPCISIKGQKRFYEGYELREKDRQDLRVLEQIEAPA